MEIRESSFFLFCFGRGMLKKYECSSQLNQYMYSPDGLYFVNSKCHELYFYLFDAFL